MLTKFDDVACLVLATRDFAISESVNMEELSYSYPFGIRTLVFPLEFFSGLVVPTEKTQNKRDAKYSNNKHLH